MRVVVLGGSGAMGGAVADRLEHRGHEVVRGSRASGPDLRSAARLTDALRGADCVLDTLNLVTTSRRRAVEFFGDTARCVADAAATAGVAHLVVLSIVNATDPALTRAVGYYAGKAAQEAEYASAGVPVTIVRTTAWFTLAETFLRQVRVGPLALVPRLAVQPLHPDAAAELLTEVVLAGPTSAPATAGGPVLRELAGPEPSDAATMARLLARREQPATRVLGLPVPLAGLRHALLPGPEVPRDDRRYEDWLARS